MYSMAALQPIGTVKSAYKDPKDLIFACEKGLHTDTHSKIIIADEYADGLRGIGEFSHIFVIYHLHKAEKIELTTHPGPPGIQLPKVGVFASRSQYRPNHMALRLVEIEKVEDNILHVKGLDAIDGTQVLDIKPYVSGFDRPEKFTDARWYGWF